MSVTKTTTLSLLVSLGFMSQVAFADISPTQEREANLEASKAYTAKYAADRRDYGEAHPSTVREAAKATADVYKQ